MGKFKDLLLQKDVIILDGALGTELENRGYDVSGKLWSAKYLLKKPIAIQEIHEVYLIAGSDIITTSSYQASIPSFLEAGLNLEESYDLIKKTVFLAENAIKTVWESLPIEEKAKRPYPLIAGSVGPYAAYLSDGSEYTGDYQLSQEKFQEFHRPRIQALLEAGSDLLAIETIPNVQETKAILDLLEKEFPQVEAYLSFTAQTESTISDGTKIEEVGKLADLSSQILALGINCTAPHLISPLLTCLQSVSKKPFVVYPNSGEIYNGDSQTWSSNPNQENTLVQNSQLWRELGARLLGGCCRTRPTDMKELADFFRNKNKTNN